MPDDPPTQRRKRRGGYRRPRERVKPGPQKGQMPFDPLSQTWVWQGQSWLAKRKRRRDATSRATIEFLLKHLQLDAEGRKRWADVDQASNLSPDQRQNRERRLTNFPPMPEAEMQEFVRLVSTYGMPLSDLPSDTAAFLVRRATLDFFRISSLKRVTRTPMFTPDELVELMRVMRLKPRQLAEVIAPENVNNANGSIQRWMHGASHPTSVIATKINRLIEQHVRRKGFRGGLGRATEDELSEKPATVERRERKRRAERVGSMAIPLSQAALRALEQQRKDADATEKS